VTTLESHVLDSEAGWQEAVRLCRRQARAVLGACPAADDAAQEAVLRAWRHRGQCRDPAQPWAWLASIARREALREVGRPVMEALDELADATADTSADDRVAVQEALGTLLPTDRALILERYVLDRTSTEIGKSYGVSPGAVRVRLHRSRAQLRGVLAGS
jgi:RNA polymerase sigma factor (sigma-70 family)